MCQMRYTGKKPDYVGSILVRFIFNNVMLLSFSVI